MKKLCPVCRRECESTMHPEMLAVLVSCPPNGYTTAVCPEGHAKMLVWKS